MDSVITNPFFIGFESIFDKASKMVDSTYPPYDVIAYTEEQKAELEFNWDYEIHLAVAGFSSKDLKVTQDGNILTIIGDNTKNNDKYRSKDFYVYKGIASRKFTKQFTLSDDVIVQDSNVGIEDGILIICLEKIKKNRDIKEFQVR
jgi:molecular chaperone IbpA